MDDSILCAVRNALEARGSPKGNNNGKAEEQMRKMKGTRKKKKGRVWNYESAMDNSLQCFICTSESKVNGRYFGRNINIFKTGYNSVNVMIS